MAAPNTGQPRVQVLLDDGTGTFPYDLTNLSGKSYVRVGHQITRGRQDELSQVAPGQLQQVVLDNTGGHFTPGSTLIASPSPIKADAKIRIIETPGPNLLSADASSFETATGGWAFNTLLGARTLGTSLAQSATRATDGTKSLLITWSTSASGNYAGVAVTCIIGQSYTFSADVYVPSGSPDVRLSTGFYGNSAFTSLKDQWVRLSVTWVATQVNHNVGVEQVTSTAGQTCYVDSAMVNAGNDAQSYVVGQSSVTRYTGYVPSWTTGWPTGGQTLSEVTITATDAQARAERRPLRSVIDEEVVPDAPTARYTMGEPQGATAAADSSGNQLPSLASTGTGSAVTFGSATGPSTDGLTAATFSGGQYLSADLGVDIATSGAVECWFTSTTNDTNVRPILASGIGLFAWIQNGNLLVRGFNAGALTDGLVHHVVYNVNGSNVDFYVDGSFVFTASLGSANSTLNVGGDVLDSGHTFIGSIAHVGVYPATLSAARITAHYQAGSTGFAGESGTARLTRLAGYASLPVGTLDTSLTNVSFKDFSGTSAAEAIRAVADAEFGLAFIDGSGNLTFHNRNRVPLKTAPDVTLDANYLDEGTTFTTDMQGILNYYEVTALGSGNGAQVVRATASETSHGRYPGSTSYLVQTDAEALDRGNWIVATHKEPGPRAGALVLDLLTMTAAQQAQMLAIEPNHWFQVTGLPSQTPGGTTANFIVQGWTEALSKDAWTLTLNVVDKATLYPSAWLLDSATNSVLDSTTRLYL